jgi:branched-chain amino acid transport system substrate-binding protein
VLGLESAQGLLLTETFYWDLNDRTRAFTNRIRSRASEIPESEGADDYAATLHYLKAVANLGVQGRRLARLWSRMKAMPTDDDCFGRVASATMAARSIRPICSK